MQIKDAQKHQARELAVLLNLAGEGLPEYLWQAMAEKGQSALEVGAERAAREQGSFSYRNALGCEQDGKLMGMILAYRLPDDDSSGDLHDYPEIVRPLLSLEARAPGSWYINAIATFARYRGRGVATALLRDAEHKAVQNNCTALSLIVASQNTTAKQLYQRLGYRETAELPVVPYPGCLHGGNWLLMVKSAL